MAAPTVSRVRKRVSKNKKRSWRKHTDIHDVEEHLADERLQLRTGGLIAEKADDELFFVDIGEDKEQSAVEPKGRRKRLPKELKCHSALLLDPKIKPAKLPRASATKQKSLRPAQLESEKKRFVNSVKARQLAAGKQRRRNKVPYSKTSTGYDLWSVDRSQPMSDAAEAGSCTPQPDTHYLSVTRKLPVKAPSHLGIKPSAIPAVEVAHPGASYNPTYDDHQSLLREASELEEKKLKQEKRLAQQLDAKFPDARDAPTEATWLHEMSAGLFDGSGENEEAKTAAAVTSAGGGDDDYCRLSLNPPVVRDNKKTRKKRRAEDEQQQKEQAAKIAAAEKRRDKDLLRLRTFKTQIRADEMKQLVRLAARREKALAEEALGTRRLGSTRFENPAPDLQLTHELSGSLRLLKPEGNLLDERFKSLQKRNIIEPRIKAKRTLKYKRKVFDKRSHRDMA